ncbi:MAG: PEP-CTERM sorting domain-containing protein [Nitrospirota bacterium]
MGVKVMALAGAAALMMSTVPTSSAWALSVTEAYVFSGWSAPTGTAAAPFTLNATSGYRLNLNSSGVAASATELVGSTAVDITDRMYYQSHTGTINAGESFSGSMANRVNYEIRRVDDAGVVNDGTPDAAMNVDFSRGSTVTLRTFSTSVAVPGLILFEDAGLDPFSLRYCYNLTCSSYDLLFNGLTSSTLSTLTSDPTEFGTDDYAPGIDQAFWFVFDGAATGGYFRIADTTNPGGTRLEVDYVGVTSAPPQRVPEPGTLLLLGSGLMGIPLFRKLRRK